MAELFLSLVNRSIAASWLVPIVFVLRLLLKKAPRWVHVLLWGMVAVRLVSPIAIESPLSLIPSAETVSPEIMADPSPSITSGIPAVNHAVNAVISQNFTPAPGASANPLQIWIPVLAAVWLAGIAAMLAYTAVTYLRLRHRVREAVLYRDNIYLSEQAGSAFVLGVWSPRIYLPYHMSEEDLGYVIAHEQAHIRRRDHWWKPLGFLLLTLHWFNPLLWWAYALFCRDIELACDEKVIREWNAEERANYSQALLACSVNRRGIAACPLAFGEAGVKNRVRSVLKYKKPGALLITVAAILCVIAAACFLTNPTAGSGIGIRAIRVASHETAAAALELDYFLLEKSGFRSRYVPAEEGEYTGDGMTEYDGALGAYRILIEFGDTEPTEEFRLKYPAGQVFTLENVPDRFWGTLKFKVVYPQDHGCAIYIGSDKPFAYKDAVVYNVKYLGGTLEFKLYNVAEQDPGMALQQLMPGLYRPVSCVYQTPDKTDATAEQLGSFTYEVGAASFSVRTTSDAVWESHYGALPQWVETSVWESLFFAEGTELFDKLSSTALSAASVNARYTFIRSVSQGTETLYLCYCGEDGVYAVYALEAAGT